METRLPRKIKKNVKKNAVLFEKRVYGVSLNTKHIRILDAVRSGNSVIFTRSYAKV